MSAPHLVALVGPDGSGKSTLATALVAHLRRHRGEDAAATVQIWDSLADLLSREAAQRYLAAVGDRSRALLLLHAVSRALDLGAARGARVLVLDGYWYKYAVSELAYGAPAALFDACPDLFPRPDLTLFLDLPPEQALARKDAITQYERGLDREQGGSREAFLAFQSRLDAHWRALEARLGPWHHLPAAEPIASLLDRTLALLPA